MSGESEFADTVVGGGPQVPGERHELARGATVGRYLMLDVLGTGGMGVVYAAYDPELDRKIAVKVVLDEPRDGFGSEGRARMLREAQAIARLSHPNVVAVHDVGTSADQLFIAMELVDGDTLTRWWRGRSVAELLAVFVQAGRGLAAAHRANLVHRDFKPDNVLVGRDGRARVVDFGLVHQTDVPDSIAPKIPEHRPSDPVLATPLTRVGTVMGTPFYMAPEQFLHETTDARSDQYSFCVSLYQALGGQLPFDGTSVAEVSAKVLAGVVPELPPNRKVAAHVRAAIRRGMSTAPAARFPTMDALLAELERDPAATRRRWLIGATVAGVGAAAIALPWIVHTRGNEDIACGDGATQLAGAWDASRRQALVQAFAATHASYADAEAAAVTSGLDSYATAWTRSYEDSCRATHERGEQSAELLDLRNTCLARRRTELAGVVELLFDTSAASVEHAHEAVAALSPVADCDDVAALQAPLKLPADPVARQQIANLRDDIDRVQAAVDAGRYRAGLARAEELVATARKLGYRPVQAEAALVLGETKDAIGDGVSSEHEYLAGFVDAMASHHDKLVALCAVKLVQVTSRTQSFARAHDWLTVADAAVDRFGNPPIARAIVHYVTGLLLVHEGKEAEAATAFEHARELQDRYEPGSANLSHTLSSLAEAYDEIGRYAEARAVGERSLALEKAALGPWHPAIADVLINLGNIADDEGDLARATDYYTRALDVRERAASGGADTSSGIADVLNNLGIIAFEQEHYDDALAYHHRALAIRETIDAGSPRVAMSLTNVADIARKRGNCDDALAGYRRALAIAEKRLGGMHPYVGDALYGIGECRLAQRGLDDAQTALERALAIRRAGARPVEIADIEFALARTRWARGDHAKALELARSARAAYATVPGNKQAAAVDTWLAHK